MLGTKILIIRKLGTLFYGICCSMFANVARLPADRVIKVNIFLTGMIALVAGSGYYVKKKVHAKDAKGNAKNAKKNTILQHFAYFAISLAPFA